MRSRAGELKMLCNVSPEQRVPQTHPLRPLRLSPMKPLRDLKSRFNRLYAKNGRPSIAPEKLL